MSMTIFDLIDPQQQGQSSELSTDLSSEVGKSWGSIRPRTFRLITEARKS